MATFDEKDPPIAKPCPPELFDPPEGQMYEPKPRMPKTYTECEGCLKPTESDQIQIVRGGRRLCTSCRLNMENEDIATAVETFERDELEKARLAQATADLKAKKAAVGTKEGVSKPPPPAAAPPPPLDSTKAGGEFSGEKSQSVSDVLVERGKKYGDMTVGHRTLGLIWTGMIENHFQIQLPHPISGELVALMNVAMKLNRESFAYQEDNYLDARGYLAIAEACQKVESRKT